MSDKPTVCVDLDGVLAYYDGWKGIEHIGDPIPGALEFCRNLSEKARVLIYTTRTKEFPGAGPDSRPAAELVRIVRAWLDRHGFAYDDVYTGQGKPFAVAYVDDRAVNCRPQGWFGEREYEWSLVAVESFILGLKPTDTSQALNDSVAPDTPTIVGDPP